MKTAENDTLLAFVDEIGDRGHSKKSSEYFAMAAVIFPAGVQQKVKDCIAKFKNDLGVKFKDPLHWRKHCHRHDVRKFVSKEIGKIEGIKVVFVISDKKTVPIDHAKFYNTVAAFTLERILRHAEKTNNKVGVWFGHVKGFNHTTTIDFFNNWDWGICKYDRLFISTKMDCC